MNFLKHRVKAKIDEFVLGSIPDDRPIGFKTVVETIPRLTDIDPKYVACSLYNLIDQKKVTRSRDTHGNIYVKRE